MKLPKIHIWFSTFLILVMIPSFLVGQTITFDGEGYTHNQDLGNPYTIVNNGETFKFTISNGGAPLATNHVYRTTDANCTNSGFSHINAGNSPATTWTIETVSGNEIDLGTMSFDNIYYCSPFNYELTIEGFKNTVSTGSQNLTVNGYGVIFNSNSSFDDVDKIVITCANLGVLGIDDINWTALGPSCNNPTMSDFSASPDVVCSGGTTTLTVTGSLNDATNWHLYTGSCGGTPVASNSTGTFNVSPTVTTTYYVRGEDGAGCVTEAPSSCDSVVVTVASTSVTSTLTFEDRGYTNNQSLGNPYTILAPNGSKLRFRALDASQALTPEPMKYFDSNGGGCSGSIDHIIPGSGPTSIRYVTIATTEGEEFDLTSINFQNIYHCLSFQYNTTIEGFKDGLSTGSAVSHTVVNLDNLFSPGSNFDDIDSIVISEPSNMAVMGIDDIIFKLNTLPCGASCTMTANITAQTNVSCFGASTGSLTVTQSSGTANFDYSWSNGSTTSGSSSSTNTISGLAAGSYTVTITDNNACTATASATVTQPASALAASATVTSTLDCFNDTDGQVTASQTGGTSLYTYSWSTGGTSATETGLGAGTYSVTITDANGCTDSASTTLTEPTSLVAACVIDSNVTCNGFSDGGATASATGGTGAYTYAWSNGATNASITGIGAGTYSVTITDANGCTDSSSSTVTEPTTLNVSASVDSNNTCIGSTDGGLTAIPSGGTASYTYSWSNGGTTASITGLAAGTYTITITDNNACTATDSDNITEPSPLSGGTINVDP